ncbi:MULTISPECIES: hypothetical protein [unclassified Micromonospora]|uniref:hypothetical protein n=1 Tax=unclassified Micromonospora TaxID=2617518 RepID=UPI003A892292
MTRAVRNTRPRTTASNAGRSGPVRVVSRSDAGVAVVAAAAPENTPAGPATNAAWAWSIRRFSRFAIWALPLYAIAFGIGSLSGLRGGGPAPDLVDGRPAYLASWVIASWLGLVTLVAIAGIHAAARSRGTAVSALLVGLAGTASTVPFVGLPDGTTVYGTSARSIALVGAALYSFGWLLAGAAVLRSELFNRLDGWLLIVASPLLGFVGLLSGPLQTVGAVLTLTAGIGLAWSAGRMVPSVQVPATAPASSR